MTKVYFPRLIVPFSSVVVCLLDFAIALVILAGLMIHYASLPGIKVLVLPFFLLLALLSSTGAGVFLAALNVKYRDFRYVVPFLIQLGFFVSPIAFSSADIYASDRIPAALKFLYSLNPMVAVIEGFRWSLLASDFPVDWKTVGTSSLVTIVLLFTGCWYFRKFENEFADVI
jgi:lipopolysaccharide transport system permease protein